MIIYESVVNGLKILLGNLVMQVSLGIVLFLYGSPPAYEGNEAKTDAAKWVYVLLSIARPAFALVTYIDTFHHRFGTVLVVFCIFAQVYIYVLINMNFVHPEGEMVFPME